MIKDVLVNTGKPFKENLLLLGYQALKLIYLVDHGSQEEVD